jgi:hypothetical protein
VVSGFEGVDVAGAGVGEERSVGIPLCMHGLMCTAEGFAVLSEDQEMFGWLHFCT